MKYKNYKQKVFEICEKKETFLKMEEYVNLLLEKNKVLNLTGFNEEQIWREGVYHSIIYFESLFEEIKKEKRIVDIGAGAGFPSIPLLIFLENKFELDIYEPIKKRTIFLEEVKKNLFLNFNIINERIEDSDKTNYYDFITARAVASLRILIELSLEIGKDNSTYIFPKGRKIFEEIEESKTIIEKLKLKYKLIEIKDEEIKNFVLIYKKNFVIPKYLPRKWEKIKKTKL